MFCSNCKYMIIKLRHSPFPPPSLTALSTSLSLKILFYRKMKTGLSTSRMGTVSEVTERSSP